METAIRHVTVMSGAEMTDYSGGTECPNGASADSVIVKDATILSVTLREAILTDPGSFLTTLVDVDTKKTDYWVDQVRSSTWVVAERGEEIVGVAGCKSPDPGRDKEDHTEGRYIESVWIIPELRGKRLAERLIKYLMGAEYRKNRLVSQFLLWVFPANKSAINLYQRLGFVQIEQKKSNGVTIEVKYCLDVNHGTRPTIYETASEAALGVDKEEYGVTYRVLGEEDSA